MKQSPAKRNNLPADKQSAGTLYLVATPIGNLSDISERALETLQEVDFIAAEDTRVTRKLTAHLGLKKPLVSYRAHNQFEVGKTILARVLSGESCALVTDAGTPAVSDPGGDLVRLFAAHNLSVVVIPGPCAAIAGLALSGLDTSRFIFEGFLPAVKGKRLSQLRELKTGQRTMVFYEAPHKLLRTLGDMLEVFGDRHISISREITKLYEQTLRTTLSGAIAHFTDNPPRGEFVLVVEGAADTPSSGEGTDSFDKGTRLAKTLIDGGMPVSEAVKKAACETGCSKNELYRYFT